MMHSFRMRYVVLGLLIYLQNAFCRTCGSDFNDIASKAVVATTVFEGKMIEKIGSSLNISGSKLYNATFEVTKVYKGNLKLRRRRKSLNVTVGEFDPKNLEQCKISVDIGSQYIVFLNQSHDSSYYTISNFPESATLQSSRKVRKSICDGCVTPVKVKLRPRDLKVNEGKTLSLRCKAEGNPPPVTEWYKDDQPIQATKKQRISNKNGLSRLKIRRTSLSDTGRYKCRIHNALGLQAHEESLVTIVSAKPKPPEPLPETPKETTTTMIPSTTRSGIDRIPSHSVPCPDDSYCLNKGTCFQVRNPNNVWNRDCVCYEGFMGYRCMEKVPDVFTRPNQGSSRDERQYDRQMTMLGIIIGVLILLGILLAAYCKAKSKKKEFRKRQAEKRRLRRELQDGYTNGNHRPQSRDVNKSVLETGLAGGVAGDNGERTGGWGVNVLKDSAGAFELSNWKKEVLDAGVQTDKWIPANDVHFSNSAKKISFSSDETCESPHRNESFNMAAESRPISSPMTPEQQVRANETLDLLVANLREDYHHPSPFSTMVSAVVESKPDRRGSSSRTSPNQSRNSPNQSQTSRTESALHPLDNDDFSRKIFDPELENDNKIVNKPNEAVPPRGIDPDSQSDEDNQQASDMEVNVESEADLQRLESSEDEKQGYYGKGDHSSSQSSSSESDTDSSSEGEEHVLFQKIRRHPPPPIPPKSADIHKPPSPPDYNHDQIVISQSEPLIGSKSPVNQRFSPAYDPTVSPAFNPYASNALESNYFGNFGGEPLPSSKKLFSKQRRLSDTAKIMDSILFDPDPDATPV